MSGRRPTTRKTPTLEAEDCEDSDGTGLDGLRSFVIAGEERSKVAGTTDSRVSTRMRIDSSLGRRSFSFTSWPIMTRGHRATASNPSDAQPQPTPTSSQHNALKNDRNATTDDAMDVDSEDFEVPNSSSVFMT